MLLALLIMIAVLTVALFLVFCRWERILKGMSEGLAQLEKGLQGLQKRLRGGNHE